MSDSKGGIPARRPGRRGTSSAAWGISPRMVLVLVVLTLTVAVVAYRIAFDAGPRRVENLVREGLRLFAAAQKETESGPPADPAEIEKRAWELTGMRLSLPKDAPPFTYLGVTRPRWGKDPATAIRFTHEEDLCLLLAVRRETFGAGASSQMLFSGPGFISGEREGRSFVFWEKNGTTFLLVSDADLSRTFELVRRYFT
jgi:hypothetical protein